MSDEEQISALGLRPLEDALGDEAVALVELLHTLGLVRLLPRVAQPCKIPSNSQIVKALSIVIRHLLLSSVR